MATTAAMVASLAPADPTSNEIVFSIWAMATGLFLLFVGYKYFKVLAVLLGFNLGYWLMYATMTSTVSANDLGDEPQWALLAICFAVGIVIGVITYLFLQFGVFSAGFMGGFFFCVWILVLVDSSAPVVYKTADKWAFLSIMAIVAGIVALLPKGDISKIAVIAGSAMVGSLNLFFGIDLLAKTGFAGSVMRILSGGAAGWMGYNPVLCRVNVSNYDDSECLAIASFCLIAAALGILIQMHLNKHEDHNRQTKSSKYYVRLN